MKKLSALLVLLLMFSVSVLAVEQSHPITQLIVPDSSPENQFDMRDGAVTFESGGLVGEHSQGNLMIADAYNQRPVWVGSPQAGGQNLRVFGDTQIDGKLDAGGVKIKKEPNYGPIIYNLDGLSFHTSDYYSVWSDDGNLNLQSTRDSGNYVEVWDELRLWGPSKISSAVGDVKIDDDLEVTGSKNFIHEINKTHEAVYTSSESPEVVVEWTSSTRADEKGVEVKFPAKYDKVLSEEDDYHVTATPVGSLADVGVFDKSDEGFMLKADKPTDVDFHVRGIREGYEDKKSLRKK